MRNGFVRECAGLGLAAACATQAAAMGLAQPHGGPSGGGFPGAFPGGGPGSYVRIGPGLLQTDPGARSGAGGGGKVGADGSSSLRDALFGARPGLRASTVPAPGRYAVDTGHGFVLDRFGRDGALVRFEDSPEIWALTAVAGPRGDLIFKNDVGEPILRATRMGGLTLFTSARPEGEAVAPAAVPSGGPSGGLAGVAASLRPPASIGPQALIQALAQASARASRAAQHLVAFDAPDVTAASDWVFADAAWLTGEAFVRLAQHAPPGRSVVARVLTVRFAAGRAPQVLPQGAVLQITVAPDRGPAGRPSSQRIMLSLEGR